MAECNIYYVKAFKEIYLTEKFTKMKALLAQFLGYS